MFRKDLIKLWMFAVVMLIAAGPLEAQPLSWTMGAGDQETAEEEEDGSTWDSGIINITVTDPGLLSLDAEGTYIIAKSGEEDLCGGGTRELPNGWMAQTQGRSSVPVRPGDYSLQLVPHGSTTVDYRVRADLTDACVGVSGDDHGDTNLCSTELCMSTSTAGSIGSYTDPDYDVFSFVVESEGSVVVESTGSTDVRAELFNERGKRLAEDDDSGSGVNFKITETLKAGRYFVRVEGTSGATGSYNVSAQ